MGAVFSYSDQSVVLESIPSSSFLFGVNLQFQRRCLPVWTNTRYSHLCFSLVGNVRSNQSTQRSSLHCCHYNIRGTESELFLSIGPKDFDGVEFDFLYQFLNKQLSVCVIHDVKQDIKGLHNTIDLLFCFLCCSKNYDKMVGLTLDEQRMEVAKQTRKMEKMPNSKRCVPVGVPCPTAYYIGAPQGGMDGLKAFEELMAKQPYHPAHKKLRGGLTKTQAMYFADAKKKKR